MLTIGVVETDTRHVCVPKVLKLKYYCGNCGRVAVSRSILCVPRTISQTKAKTKVKVKVKPKTRTTGKKATTKKKK